MILEISDYLLIRNCLIQNNNEDGLFNIDNEENQKEQFNYFVKAISALMQYEDLPLLCDNMQEEIDEAIQKYRFKYNNSEIRDDINYIITRLNEYKKISQRRKKYLINEWYLKECKDRLLPKKYWGYDYVNLMVLYDFNNFNILTGRTEPEDNYLNLIFSISKNENRLCTMMASTTYISTLNLMLNRFREKFSDEAIIKTLSNVSYLPYQTQLPKEDIKYLYKSVKQIGKGLKN